MPKIVSANLNGIRSAAKKGFFDWLQKEAPDFVCVQELKAQAADMTEDFLAPAGYVGHFHCQKKGYSGVGVYSRRQPDRCASASAIPNSMTKAAMSNATTAT
jgi:exodeoxyribonuclease-3